MIKERQVNPLGIAHSLDNSRKTDGWRYIHPQNTMRNKYQADKERMDIITERLVHRSDIWQDRYIYWIAVAIGHILEWIVKHGNNIVADGSDSGTTDNGKGE